MKKLVFSALLVTSLIAGCSNSDNEAKKDVEEVEATEVNNEKAEATPSKETREITPEQAKETLTKITDNAKKDQQVKEVLVEESDASVKATVEFEEDATDKEKAIFILNYQIMLQASHPDKEIEFDIKK